MSVEHLDYDNQRERQGIKLSRRELFKKWTNKWATVAVATGAAAIGLSVVGNEIAKGKDGAIETREGIYYPIYEWHDKWHDVGISTKDIPQNIDALFTEGGVPGEINDDIAKRGILLVSGDVEADVSGLPYSIIEAEAGIGALAILSAQFLVKRRNNSSKRREIIKLGLKGAFLYLSLPLLSKIALVPLFEQKNDSFPNFINRTVRLDGIVSDIHPEHPIVFLRNAIMANNLLNTGDYLKEKLDRKPKIAYWVGGAHSGIEDFLQAGKNACRDVILAYPARYLQSIVDNSNPGYIDYLCSSLLVKLDSKDPYEKVESTKILDNKLKQKLLAKL